MTDDNGHEPATEDRPLSDLPERAIAADTALVVEVTAGKVDELISDMRAAQAWRDTATRWMLEQDARTARIEKGLAELLRLAKAKP